jgi:hypothetical protein
MLEYAVRNIRDSDLVGLTIRSTVNMQDKATGISFRRKDQLSENIIWSVFEKVAQYNARFNALDSLIVEVHSVRMPVGFGGFKTTGRQLSVMAHLKSCIIEDKAEENCLAHALIIAVGRLTNDPNYVAYREGRKIRQIVDRLLELTGIDLTNGGGIPELTRFQEHFKDYRIVGYGVLDSDTIIFDGQIESKKTGLIYSMTMWHAITT